MNELRRNLDLLASKGSRYLRRFALKGAMERAWLWVGFIALLVVGWGLLWTVLIALLIPIAFKLLPRLRRFLVTKADSIDR